MSHNARVFVWIRNGADPPYVGTSDDARCSIFKIGSEELELNNKEQWRAFLAKGTAEYESEDRRINDSPASVEQYAQALREIEVDITFKQKQMLIGHALALGQILTMSELASLADGEGFQVANSQYGALGKKLTQALGLAKPAWWVYTLASFEDGPDSKKRLAHMHTPLRDALEQLGWLPTVGSTIRGGTIKANRAPNFRVSKVLSIDEVVLGLTQVGFVQPVPPIKKVARFLHPTSNETVFVKLSSSENSHQRTPLVVHSRFEAHLEEWLQIDGVIGGRDRFYHNADMGGFLKRKHGGEQEIHYGIDLGLQHAQALQDLLAKVIHAATQATVADGLKPTATVALPYSLDDSAHNDTERDALIKARIGQGAYREALLAYWESCAVTGCMMPDMLRASHIKPWRSANAEERLDLYNGLLLAPNLDLAFDRGLISFDDCGNVMLSPQLDNSSADSLHLRRGLLLRKITPRHHVYLAWHRKNVFRT